MIIFEKNLCFEKWNYKNTISSKVTKILIKKILFIINIKYKNFLISVEYINDEMIQKINFEHRGKNIATDVLSFEDKDKDLYHLNISLYLSYETILNQSINYNIKFKDRLLHLYLHGILHCFGFDHIKKNDQKKMEEIEKSILKDFNIIPY
jgi:probable rRNA maturation factor